MCKNTFNLDKNWLDHRLDDKIKKGITRVLYIRVDGRIDLSNLDKTR